MSTGSHGYTAAAPGSGTSPGRAVVSRLHSIRSRVLALALVPCTALLATAAAVVVVLANDARASATWSDYLARQIEPAVRLASAAHQERRASMLALYGDTAAAEELPGRRQETDAVLEELGRVADRDADLNAAATAQSTPAFLALVGRLPDLRRSVDARAAAAVVIDEYYAQLTGIVILGLNGSARSTPDALAATEQATAAQLLLAADLHSRAMAAAAEAAVRGELSAEQRQSLAGFVGAYRHLLGNLTPEMTEAERADHQALVSGDSWKTAVAAEDSLASGDGPAIPPSDWQSAQDAVHTHLLALFREHAGYALHLARDAATASNNRSLVLGTVLAGVAVAIFALAFRIANTLVRRLRALRTGTLENVSDRLPAILHRIHGGEQVDIDRETPVLDDGRDEIGEVAYAFSVAQRTAVAMAVTEARTRDGFNKVFLDIAHRSQTLVRRQLDILDRAERIQDDPEQLEMLFTLDHLATRARRNAENLVILGGGQPRRRWREPVVLDEIVRSAISETEGYARVDAIRLPDTRIIGAAVADLIHLLAELIDNATAFSPPHSTVTVQGAVVARGVAIEVDDQGLGIRADERQALNELLRDPPQFADMAVAGGRHLGLFVVGHLAKRRSITVSLEGSAYGGTKAVVLVPSALVSPTTDGHREQPRHRKPVPALRRPVVVAHRDTTADDVAPTQTFAAIEPDRGTPHPADPRPQLPRRRRQASLAPELRLDHGSAAAEPAKPEPPARDAERVRTAMASFQRGTHLAKNSAQPTHTHNGWSEFEQR
ncbi:sensor histidine kinase [Nocardia farcinica]|uniref:sensor histidine kinase n=1 Tax=Nocardia farcinica TaxID=37329 RepID=UPI000A3A3102|nr:nitrate- and nitrite sensing domain-containing protein [Nocardia farcinica]